MSRKEVIRAKHVTKQPNRLMRRCAAGLFELIKTFGYVLHQADGVHNALRRLIHFQLGESSQ